MSLLSLIIDSVYPPKCIACEEIFQNRRKMLCANCESQINWLRSNFFSENLARTYFDSARSIAAFDGIWAKLLHDFKYNDRTDLADPFSCMLSSHVVSEYDTVAPVPLYVKRLKIRGYNQSALLTKKIARDTGFRCDLFLLSRVKEGLPQVGLDKRGRLENVKGAFTCSKNLNGGHVLLIDDVMTTGATVNECAKVLKKANAGKVDVLTLARA